MPDASSKRLFQSDREFSGKSPLPRSDAAIDSKIQHNSQRKPSHARGGLRFLVLLPITPDWREKASFGCRGCNGVGATPPNDNEMRCIMANETLRAFYRGNLTPWDKRIIRSSKEVCIVKELSDAENLLAQALPSDLRPILERLTKAQGDLDGIVAETSYIDGFRTGARFMMEILDDADENPKSVTE